LQIIIITKTSSPLTGSLPEKCKKKQSSPHSHVSFSPSFLEAAGHYTPRIMVLTPLPELMIATDVVF
jgi:hypothetical protein